MSLREDLWKEGGFPKDFIRQLKQKKSSNSKRKSKTIATVSLQNYFRMYDLLAGMTGTAVTEAQEFHKIYELDVVVIPTNKEITKKR